MNTDRKVVEKWVARAQSFFDKFVWNRKDKRSKNMKDFLKLFQDRERTGRPITYTPEQVCQIIKVGLEKPEKSKRPITHWTARELADEVNKRGITKNISTRTVGRILNETDLKPHKFQQWLNANFDNPQEFEKEVEEVCIAYKNAIARKKQRTNTVCVDEKTGIQALQHLAPAKAMKPGSTEKIEFEYKRNGTLCLIPSFEVSTGKIIEYRLEKTRNEFDFVEHIKKTVQLDPQACWIFISDQLNTHMSESLVRFVADFCAIKDDLGKKGKHGIMKNMKTRKAFLMDKSHKIYFVYTPKHSSWLNQVEIWFSVITKKLLKRSSFNSAESMKEKICDFISYYNDTMSKPYKWTYSGKVLKS
jgi:transposase